VEIVGLAEAKAHPSRHVERATQDESARIQLRGVPAAELCAAATIHPAGPMMAACERWIGQNSSAGVVARCPTIGLQA